MSHDVSDFDSEVIARSHEIPVLCDFWAPWCGPCRMLGPVLEQLAAHADGRWELAKLNTDEKPEPAQRFQIRGIPAVKLFVDGEVVAEFTGAQSATMIEQWLAKHLPERTAPALKSASAALEQLDFANARELLRGALPDLEGADRERARYLLARAALWQDPAEALSLLRDLPAGIAEAQELDAVRTLATALLNDPDLPAEASENRQHYLAGYGYLRQGRIEEAMNHFTEILWDHPRYADGAVFRLQGALLRYLGSRHPLHRRHWNAFSGAADVAS